MCSPGLSLATQAFGTGMSTVGAIASGNMQQSTLRSQARIAEINATLADSAARAELFASEREQNQIYLRGSQLKAAQRSAYAGRGIDIGVGTPVDVANSTDYITQVDANTARANGIQAAWGRRIEAGNYRAQARSARAEASSISPLLSGATTLLSGASQVAQSWYSFSRVGAFGQPAPAAGPAPLYEAGMRSPENIYGETDRWGFPTFGGIAVRVP